MDATCHPGEIDSKGNAGSVGGSQVVWTLSDIADWTDGEVRGGGTSMEIEEISVDSREVMAPKTLFVALEGERFDGHDFVQEAAKKGAEAALVRREWARQYGGDLPLVVVDETLEALQRWASGWRGRFDIPVVGITGSNGKTIVKDMLASIVGRNRSVYRSPGSYNSQVGVPLALLGIRKEHEVAIIEAGISRTGEMVRLEEMIRPTAGIVTNIGLAHVAGLGDRETTAREKRKLFVRTDGRVVVPADESLLSRDVFHVKRLPVGGGEGPTGADSECELAVSQCDAHDGGFRFELTWRQGRKLEVSLNVPGKHNVANAAMAAAMAASLGADDEAIVNGLGAYSLRSMRLEMHTTGTGITLINDAYNADPTSVRAALGVLDNYAGRQRRIAILGDMLDLGGRTEQAHREIGADVARLGIDRLFGVGRLARYMVKGAVAGGMDEEDVEHVQDFEVLHRRLEDELRSEDVVLFKASRNIELDRAARRLLESVAPTRLHIDLEAIGDNFHALRRHLDDGVGVMAVVKSFGYGNDATRISQTLVQHGVDALAVAFPDEAIPLRNRGLSVPILVTNARAAEADKLVKYDLEPLVYTERVAEALARQARQRNRRVGIHLAVDTGMRRAGLRPGEVVDFAESLERWPRLDIAGLMTHFAVADVPGEDEFTHRQIEEFQQVVDELSRQGIEPPVVHAANTAAAWRFPRAQFDMVRIGLGLYGLHPSHAVEEQTDGSVRPALRMTTRVLHVQQLEEGESVGYGRTWRAPERRIVATLAAGYNDGFPYFLSNCGDVLIKGERCPVVGSICMDVAVVDVTEVDEKVAVGDEAVLFGRQQNASIHIDEWARLGDTINYELLCNISPRVRRIFRK